jgi:MYXO-CTERM domain-containing protein
MIEGRRRILLATMFLGAVAGWSREASACGPGETQQYQSQYAIWCVDDTVWSTGQSAFQSVFFPYGDAVVQELEALFAVTPKGLPLIIEAVAPDGGAQTPPKCCGNGCNEDPCIGEAVTGDAYTGSAYNVQGFWGYLLTLHELINQWTGYVSGGWPTDFWADHVSAFPNSTDWHIMATLGAKLGDANLTAASAAQKARFYPGGDSTDPRVGMFDQIYALPGMGYAGWAHVFALVQGDAMSWDGLGVGNPAELRTEYVAAYVSLGPGLSVLPILQAANVANGTQDGVSGDPAYTANEANIDAIATDHCAIAAAAAQGADESADRASFTSGDFAGVKAKGKCGAGCPVECGCKSSTDECVAPWLGDASPDGGVSGGDSGTASSSSSGSGGSGGGVDSGVALHDAGTAASDGGSLGAAPGGPGSSSSSGCGCHALPDGGSSPAVLVAALTGLALVRLRRRR